MAAPAFRAASAILAVQNGTADGTLTLPTHQTDDILIIATFRKSLTNTLTISGWTQIATWDGGLYRNYIFGKRAASGSETNPLLDWASTSGDFFALCCSYSGCITTGTAWEVVGSGQNGTGNDPTLTGITTLSAESLVLPIILYGDDNNTAFALTSTDPAAYTEHYVESLVGSDGSVMISEGARSSAGATGDIAVSGLTVTVGREWNAIVLALIPPAAGGGSNGFRARATHMIGGAF
ncbi:MAG TPA: hypothetical protein VJS69_00485 [Candidatus Krumholzibacteria bacterium]|nr:hypothetical protein [Candidatus Krumholzibacteria bacterium]